MKSTLSRKQLIQHWWETSMWVDKSFCKHKLVSLVKWQWWIRRKDVCDGDRACSTNASATIYQNLCSFIVHRPQPFDRLSNKMNLNRIMCTIAHCNLAVRDRHWLVLVTLVGFGDRWWIDHVEIVCYIQHMCKTKLSSICCCNEIAEMNVANDVIVVRSLKNQVQQKISYEMWNNCGITGHGKWCRNREQEGQMKHKESRYGTNRSS